MWLLWVQSQGLRQAPSEVFGLTRGSLEAYCFDQAVWYFGTTLQEELNKVGRKPQKGEAANAAGRKRVLEQVIGTTASSDKGKFADPALLFGTK